MSFFLPSKARLFWNSIIVTSVERSFSTCFLWAWRRSSNFFMS